MSAHRQHSRASIYNEIASHYWETFGEPLYAADEWLDPIIEQVTIAVENDPGLEPAAETPRAEIVDRVACVVAVMTEGRSALRGHA